MPYKEYDQNTPLLLPPSLDELIPENDMVRVINRFVEYLPKSSVENKYKNKTGCPSFHPRMMLKVILYAYSQNIYSCRKIAKAIRQNVNFMWLSAMQRPDFNTINRFRSDYLKECISIAYVNLMGLLLDKEYIKYEDYFIDGTKLEADVSRTSYVWRKNVKRNRERIQLRAKEIFEDIERLNQEEDKRYGSLDLPETGEAGKIKSTDIKKAAESLEKAVETVSGDEKKTLGKTIKNLKKDAEKLERYEEQEEILNNRNSYSKTDHDATFMRMKGSEEVRGGYNVQVGTEKGFVTGYSIGQNANDASLFIEHMEKRKEMGLPQAKNIIGDSVYGTEENYSYLEKEKITSYLKYPNWYREQKCKLRTYEKMSFKYDKENDTFICPEGRQLIFSETEERRTKSGYASSVRRYKGEDCYDCAEKDECTKSSESRSIEHSEKLARYMEEARSNLMTEKGIELRKRRGPEVETVFGELKHNKQYRRLRLRGLKKGFIDLTWLFLSYNIKRMAKMIENKWTRTSDIKEKLSLKACSFIEKVNKLMEKFMFYRNLRFLSVFCENN